MSDDLKSFQERLNRAYADISVDAAQKHFDDVHEKYRTGVGTYKDYLDAWHELSKAKRALPSGTSNNGGWSGWGTWDGSVSQDESEAGSCAHDWKIYDSGFTRLEYCSKCNEERKLD
jgi:hypothetical protein